MWLVHLQPSDLLGSEGQTKTRRKPENMHKITDPKPALESFTKPALERSEGFEDRLRAGLGLQVAPTQNISRARPRSGPASIDTDG